MLRLWHLSYCILVVYMFVSPSRLWTLQGMDCILCISVFLRLARCLAHSRRSINVEWMNDLTEAWSLSGLVFIACSVFLSGLPFLLTWSDCSSRALGRNSTLNIPFHGSWAFVQGLQFAYLGVFQKLRWTGVLLATGEIALPGHCTAVNVLQRQGLGAGLSLTPF